MGWASGRFGFFGITKQNDVANDWLNVLGVLVCLSSLAIYFFVETTLTDAEASAMKAEEGGGEDADAEKALVSPFSQLHSQYQPVTEEEPATWQHVPATREHVPADSDFGALDRLPPSAKKIVGFGGQSPSSLLSLLFSCSASCFALSLSPSCCAVLCCGVLSCDVLC